MCVLTPFYNPSLLPTGIFPDTNFPKVIQKVGLFINYRTTDIA